MPYSRRIRRNHTGNATFMGSATRDANGKLRPTNIGDRSSLIPAFLPYPSYTSPDISLATHGANCTETFCEEKPDYPHELFNRASIKQQLDSLQKFFGEDVMETIGARSGVGPDEESLCQVTNRMVYPKEAQTIDKTWLTIVNHDKYKQGVLIEECK